MDLFSLREWEVLTAMVGLIFASFWYFYEGLNTIKTALKTLSVELPRLSSQVDSIDNYIRKHDVDIAELKVEVSNLKHKGLKHEG